MDAAALHIGDTAGLCALQGCFAQVGIKRVEDGCTLEMLVGTPGADFRTTGPVKTIAAFPVPGCRIRLRADFDFDLDQVRLSWLDGDVWQPVGEPHQLLYQLDHFMGCRIGLFTYAAQTVGGTARFTDFTYQVLA